MAECFREKEQGREYGLHCANCERHLASDDHKFRHHQTERMVAIRAFLQVYERSRNQLSPLMRCL